MTDEFEEGYLGAEGVVHREKVAFRAAFVIVGLLSLASAVFSGIAFVAAATGELEALAGGVFFAVVAGVLGLASVVGSVLRTIVTKREVVLHAGIRHEVRIPLVGITGVGLTRYDADARQRVLAEGKGAFVAIHPTKEIVRIEWVDASGKDHVAYAASEAPEALAAIIRSQAASARSRGRGPAARVEVPDSVEHDEERTAEQDEARGEREREA